MAKPAAGLSTPDPTRCRSWASCAIAVAVQRVRPPAANCSNAWQPNAVADPNANKRARPELPSAFPIAANRPAASFNPAYVRSPFATPNPRPSDLT